MNNFKRYLTKKPVVTVKVLLQFSLEDVDVATKWAESRKYKYDNVDLGLLLFDAYSQGFTQGQVKKIESDHDD